MKKFLVSMLLLAFFGTLAFASGVEGKWKGQYELQNGPEDITFVFKVSGDKLTGTATVPTGEYEVENGKVTGKEIEFSVNYGGYEFKYKGTVEGDKLTLKWSIDTYEGEFTIERVT